MITLSLVSKTPVAGNIWLFTFEPSRSLDWVAGQFVRVELPHRNPDQEGTKRYFTIASAPFQKQIEIATRITSSSFKSALRQLPVGGQLQLLDLPAGDFTWPRSGSRPLVFAAQGIGLTPVRSLIRQRLYERNPIPATLVYANLAGPPAFPEELAVWSSRPEFQLHAISEPVTPKLLADMVPSVVNSHVYVSGPRSLVGLLAPPINLPVAYLKHDQFPNYSSVSY